MDTIDSNFEQFVHVHIQYSQQHQNDDVRLLRGTADEISDSIRETVNFALKRGDAAVIELRPVRPWQIWKAKQ